MIWVVGVFAAAVALSLALQDDGYVLITLPPWRIEISPGPAASKENAATAVRLMRSSLFSRAASGDASFAAAAAFSIERDSDVIKNAAGTKPSAPLVV